MTGFELWLLGSVVIPDAYERVVDRAAGALSTKRLRRTVRHLVPKTPRATFDRWYELDSTWVDLVSQGREAYERLVESLMDISGRRLLRGRLERDHAAQIVQATIEQFVASLPPSEAVAVADYRSAARDRVHDRLEAERSASIHSRLDGVEELLTAQSAFEVNLSALPDAVRPLLMATRSPAVERLVEAVARNTPTTAFVELTVDVPGWLINASAEALVAAGELAQAYGVRDAPEGPERAPPALTRPAP